MYIKSYIIEQTITHAGFPEILRKWWVTACERIYAIKVCTPYIRVIFCYPYHTGYCIYHGGNRTPVCGGRAYANYGNYQDIPVDGIKPSGNMVTGIPTIISRDRSLRENGRIIMASHSRSTVLTGGGHLLIG